MGSDAVGIAPIRWKSGTFGAGPEQRYTVKPGDTLWTIAVKHFAGDPRDAIYRIDRRNHLGSGVIVPGQRLVLPSAH